MTDYSMAYRPRHTAFAAALLLGVLLPSSWAEAGDFNLFGTSGEYKLTLNYALAARTRNADQALINGPVDPLQTGGPVLATGQQPAQPATFGRTGLPSTINIDDGNRNFAKWDLFHNRLASFGELQLKRDNYGLAFSGDAFYDDVYAHKNANTSPDTVNKTGDVNRFTSDARRYDGRRIRLLDAYGYADFAPTEDIALNVRLGQQVVAFGESLFLRGMALSSGRADATRASVPGAEIKELLLPINQLGFSMGFGGGLTVLGYYQLQFKPTELFPAGDFLSPVDLLGPGGKFAYGSINPAGSGGCPGLFGSAAIENATCGNPASGGLLNAPRTINVQRGPDILPSDWGQWGMGFKYPITTVTTLGLYHLRYADSNPTVKLNPGFAYIGEDPVTRTPVTTQVINQLVPVTYQAKYFNGIHLTSLTFSTAAGMFNVSGEFNYRTGSDLQTKAVISKVLAPVFTRGDVGQVLVSALSVFNPQFFFDEFVFVGELGYVHVFHVDPFPEEPGIIPVGDGKQLFGTRNALGFQVLSYLNKRNILPGIDFKTTVTFGEIAKGNPSLSGAYGPIYGEGDRRLGLGFSAQYLQNFEAGISFQKFFGDANKKIRGGAGESPAGGSSLSQNPYADRDYIALNFKYSI